MLRPIIAPPQLRTPAPNAVQGRRTTAQNSGSPRAVEAPRTAHMAVKVGGRSFGCDAQREADQRFEHGTVGLSQKPIPDIGWAGGPLGGRLSWLQRSQTR